MSLQEAPQGADPEALWLAQVAHDLRNQLAPMRTATQMMQIGKLDAARQREMLDLLERQIQRQVGMLDDLAEYGRQRAGVLPARERHDLAILIDTALGECGRRLIAAGQRFEQRMPEQRMPLLAERRALVQSFVRLLDNASRYTPEGGLIELDVTLQDGGAEVRVRDSGAGIEAGQLESIFELPLKGRSGGGLGISLLLARACAQRHGGTLVACSAGPGRGSEFVLRLPLSE